MILYLPSNPQSSQKNINSTTKHVFVPKRIYLQLIMYPIVPRFSHISKSFTQNTAQDPNSRNDISNISKNRTIYITLVYVYTGTLWFMHLLFCMFIYLVYTVKNTPTYVFLFFSASFWRWDISVSHMEPWVHWNQSRGLVQCHM